MKNFKIIFDIFTHAEKKKFIFVFVFILIMAIIDALGVASIFPFIAVLTNPTIIETNPIINYFYINSTYIGIANYSEFTFFLGIFVFLFLIISISFRAFATFAHVNFSLMCEHSISSRLIKGYLNQPYEWFLKKNSADLGKTILSEVSTVVSGFIMPMMSFIVHSSISLTMGILIIIVNPILAIIVGLLFLISYSIFFFSLKNFLKRKGSDVVKLNLERFKSVNEAFQAFKDVKFNSLESIYINRFIKTTFLYARNQSLASTAGQLPRFFIEMVSFGGLILLILFLMKFKSANFLDILPVLSLFIFVCYRLMPSLNQIYLSLTQMQFAGPSLNSLNKNFKDLNSFLENLSESNSDKIIMPLKKFIKLENINFSYADTKYSTLKNINFIIPALSKIGIIGATGSGKSTLINIILGLLNPTEGVLLVDDNIINLKNKLSWQMNIGYVPQDIFLKDGSIAENIAFGQDNIDHMLVEECAKISNLHSFVTNQLPNSFETNVGERGVRLSGGQRQRIGIARAIYKKPKVLIFDEATSALDNLTEKVIMDAISNFDKKITIIIITHRLNTVQNCDNIFFLDKGELIAQGSFLELKKNSDLFNRMSSLT